MTNPIERTIKQLDVARSSLQAIEQELRRMRADLRVNLENRPTEQQWPDLGSAAVAASDLLAKVVAARRGADALAKHLDVVVVSDAMPDADDAAFDAALRQRATTRGERPWA